MQKKLLRILLCVAMIAALTVGCGKETKEESAESSEPVAEEASEDFGTIVVGVDGAYPPYCYLNDDDELEGFEISVMKEIADRNDLDIECQVTSWDSMFGQLDSGRIDTVAEAITITDERLESYVFSKSYIEDSNRFMVRAGEEKSISSFEDLAGKKIGVASGQMAYDQLVQIQEEYGVEFEIVPYTSSTNATDVSLGRIDASYMNPIAGMTASDEGDLNLAVADCEAYQGDLCAYPFLKDSDRGTALAEIFSKTLEEMKEDGTLSKLSEEWLGLDISKVE